MKFADWLKKQTKRDDPIGDLARDNAGDPDLPDDGTFATYWEYLTFQRHAADVVLENLRDAWKEYEDGR
jgi:YozE SAM-like fold